ncbi:methylaspartate mutase [Streptomyces sp. ZAF1911]|uniref:methylaspartate mutase n=1 Tax=Streptomyces sp. ZAF1911 TaxID=2944129 RepID=UPI00237A805C|nr:methylaspartate mutase [Streptomyces sp. ZAF1911]MDD9377925.1 methylaspartate mutase [Streptomyces sp. ZAF1911]
MTASPAPTALPALPAFPAFSSYVAEHHAQGRLVVQPRMGFGTIPRMRDGLRAVAGARADTVATLTLDSYTRVGDHASADLALRDGHDLNGYPLVLHGAADTRDMVAEAVGTRVPVQVRHGSAQPLKIFRTLLDAGLDATEGGPVSYCLPYSRVPLAKAVEAWAECCEVLAPGPGDGRPGHLESFAGCMLGQLCPPSLTVALSVLEGLFFRQHGLRSISLSYAQQVHAGQDLEAIRALRRLIGEFLPDLDTHIVVYTFMGLFPNTPEGAAAISRDSVELAMAAGAHRLIVKTAVESSRIPTVAENVEALELAAQHAARFGPQAALIARTEHRDENDADSETYLEARALIDAVRGLRHDIGDALVTAFRTGVLDLPYCLHPDNAGRTRTAFTPEGRLTWADTGRMPLPPRSARTAPHAGGSAELLRMLSENQRRYDLRPAPPVLR